MGAYKQWRELGGSSSPTVTWPSLPRMTVVDHFKTEERILSNTPHGVLSQRSQASVSAGRDPASTAGKLTIPLPLQCRLLNAEVRDSDLPTPLAAKWDFPELLVAMLKTVPGISLLLSGFSSTLTRTAHHPPPRPHLSLQPPRCC